MKRWRSRPYRLYVASLPCFWCGGGHDVGNGIRCQATHLKFLSNPTMSDKPADYYMLPMCCENSMNCHGIYDGRAGERTDRAVMREARLDALDQANLTKAAFGIFAAWITDPDPKKIDARMFAESVLS